MVRALVAAALCASASLANTLAGERCNPCPGAANTNDVILEAREVNRLSDKIQAGEVALRSWKLKGKRVAEFKKRQEKSLKEQIKVREHIAGISDKDVAEHKAAKKKVLGHQMCTLVYQAFLHDGDAAAKTKLVKLCMGREDLDLLSTRSTGALRGRRDAPPVELNDEEVAPPGGIMPPVEVTDEVEAPPVEVTDEEAPPVEVTDEEAAPAVELTDEEEALASSPKVQQMKKELEVVQGKVKKARDDYYADQEKNGEDRRELSDQEADLGNEAIDETEDKWEASDEAWEEVKEDWCPAFNSGEDAAIEYAKENCD